MICALLLVSALAAPRTINLELKDAPLLDAIQRVIHDGAMRVAVAPEVLAASADFPTLTLTAREIEVQSVLDALLSGGGLEIRDQNSVPTIVIAKSRTSALKSDGPAPQQAVSASTAVASTADAASPVVASTAKRTDAHAETGTMTAVAKSSPDPSTAKGKNVRVGSWNLQIVFHPHASARE